MTLRNDTHAFSVTSAPCLIDELILNYHLPQWTIFHTDKLFPRIDGTLLPPIEHADIASTRDEENQTVMISGPDVTIDATEAIHCRTLTLNGIIIDAGTRVLPVEMFKYGPLIMTMGEYAKCKVTYYSEPIYLRRLRLINTYLNHIVIDGVHDKENRLLVCAAGVLSWMPRERVHNGNIYVTRHVDPLYSRSNITRVCITAYKVNDMIEDADLNSLFETCYDAIELGNNKQCFDVRMDRDRLPKLRDILTRKYSGMSPHIEIFGIDVRSGLDLNYQYMSGVAGNIKTDLAELNKMYEEHILESPPIL